jgi:hypothetical protein
MKKIITLIALIAFAFNSDAQEFRIGGNVGLPIGDAEMGYSVAFGADLNYTWNVAEKIDLGLALSYYQFIAESNGFLAPEDASFLPLGVAGRFKASEKILIGADLGYGIGIMPDGNDGGFYYRPLLGYNLNDLMQITTSYKGVSIGGGTFSSINLGFNFKL